MNKARALIAITAILVFVALAMNLSEAQGRGDAERGQYIVEHVAMCIQCHTPRDEQGNLLLSQMLGGAPMPLKSPYSSRPFAFAAPRIAGMPGYSEEQGLKLLMEGITRFGTTPQAPMPPFRMNEQDARDVVSYLKSIQ